MQDLNSSVVIVGGGVSGILLALRLSKNISKKTTKIVMLEKQAQIGGRFFFSPPHSVTAKNYENLNLELLECARIKKNMSGPGFETLSANWLETFYRHIESQLSEEEKNELDFCLNLDSHAHTEKKRNLCFFVKKEFVSETEVLSGSSSILTKKEAQVLNSLVFDFYNRKSELNEEMNDNKIEDAIFEKSKFWTDLPKITKDSLDPILKTIVGLNWEKASFMNVCKALWLFFSKAKEAIPNSFKRESAIELVIEKILRKRGVEIRTLCQVSRVNILPEKKFQLILSDEFYPQHNKIVTDNVVLTIPLHQCLSLLPKEYFSASQSRYLSRISPVSMVFLEISNFSVLKSETFPERISAYDNFVFPVEKVKGYFTSDDRFVLSTELDYEESLHAPAVREAVSRLRRASARILSSDVSNELKRGAQMPKGKIYERIVLLPVGYSVPIHLYEKELTKEGKMGAKGLYYCGDNFRAFTDDAWKQVVNDVCEVSSSFAL